MVLVIQFQDKLNNARAINVRVDGAEVRWIIKAKISWNSQADPIPGIECFGPELELVVLPQRNSFAHADVSLPQTWGSGHISGGIAKRAGGGHRKGRWVDPR